MFTLQKIFKKWLLIDSITGKRNAQSEIRNAERNYQHIFVQAVIFNDQALLTQTKIVDWES